MSSLGSCNFSRMTSMLSQVWAGQHRREGLAGRQSLDGKHRVVVHLTAVAAVQAIIQVVPPAAVALRAPQSRMPQRSPREQQYSAPVRRSGAPRAAIYRAPL